MQRQLQGREAQIQQQATLIEEQARQNLNTQVCKNFCSHPWVRI